jgi:hypothetical protein
VLVTAGLPNQHVIREWRFGGSSRRSGAIPLGPSPSGPIPDLQDSTARFVEPTFF